MKLSTSLLGVVLTFAGLATTLHAVPFKLAPFYTDNMVFQREKPIVILGSADVNATIEGSFMGGTAKTQADNKGTFKLILPAKEVSNQGNTALIKCGESTITLKDVLVGDVWFCSGQSNMEWTMGNCAALAADDIAAANFPTIRRIKFNHEIAVNPVPFMNMKVTGPWTAATPATVGGWTAAGFYFARNINTNTKIPIGILDCNWGGTKIEPWTPAEAFNAFPALSNDVKTVQSRFELLKKNVAEEEEFQKKLEAAKPEDRKKIRRTGLAWSHGSPTAIYNAIVDGLTPMPIKGALWYQGCSNAGDALYDKHMEALVSGWRAKWGYEFPFYFVQLANYQEASNDPANVGWGKVRNLQLNAFRTIPSIGMAVIIDIGEAKNIHPHNKFDVGERLARWAMRDLYGAKETVVSGPIYKAMTVSGKKAIISFDYVAAGDKRQALIIGIKDGKSPAVEQKNGKLEGFAVQDKEGKWSWANAVIEGTTVVVTHPDGKEPVNVRYAFQSNPKANLYNKEGLPASPFTTEK
jgi:sialate O-acetylesterase